MKRTFISLMLLATVSSFAQEAGKAGKLLKNEASKTEMKASKERTDKDKTSDYRTWGPIFPEDRVKNYTYLQQNYGYAEVFLRIPEHGFFTVEIGDQMMANGTGKYRFFDLQAGALPISIYENGLLIYQTTLTLRNNNRTVLDFFTHEGLYLLDSYPLKNHQYGFNDWDDLWNNPYGNHSGNGHYSGNVMDHTTFGQFFEMLQRNEKFDDGKIALINQQMKSTLFTSVQIRDLVKIMSFDKNKLALAKSMYPNCADKNRFFVVYDAFDFEGSKRELMDYISKL
ncbi:DUF4476 domain-containing protein [Chryseobacterium pennipullorum]|uniref:DUF4476 domain-containing protein n=1 Tax=Chryseobacterium pennipullorum TaxID=2258963 RepID=A0A3D9B9R3_9FLAO|nr:DUF4476 domain-containing protein [Chryseobacterium pennipullorum]REC50119.1 hypothetical protein DRF67_00840 [Chryseobacterium pennipullorum]